MQIRRLFLSVFLTLCAASLAWWILSVYDPEVPVQNLPDVSMRFSGKQAMQQLHVLTHQFKNRVVGSPQGFAAADYVADQFRLFGLEVETQDYHEVGLRADNTGWGWYKGQNVIGILLGQEAGTVVLTAHRDCVPEAPEGAYDNGSGTAAVLELARVMAESGPHRYTYVFAALDGEEYGLTGSRVLMNNRPAELKDVRLMINLDMVGLKGIQAIGITHTQYLSPETRALVASDFDIPYYDLFQFPAGRGTDALLYAWRGLPTLDFYDMTAPGIRGKYHSTEDTYDQISAESIQLAGRTAERLIRRGDTTGAFTRSQGLVASNSDGILLPWRYRLGGACILAALMIPILFCLCPLSGSARPVGIMVILVLLALVLTAASAQWTGGFFFIALPILGTIAFVTLQAVATRRSLSSAPGLGRLILSAAPSLLFAGTWLLTGLWPLGLWVATLAYLPAVLVAWKPGWGWRVFDVFLILPVVLGTWLIGVGSWILAPLHAFPPTKLPLFSALYLTVTLIGIWGIFGRRRVWLATSMPSPDAEEK